MHIEDLFLKGLKKIKPQVFFDPRGYNYEGYQMPRYHSFGINSTFVQDNVSLSKKNTIRGMHFSHQDKLVFVLEGKILDVAVDVRKDSKTFGQYEAVILDDENHFQLFIPQGFAHGFCVLSESATVFYKLNAPFDPAREKGFLWNDPTINIDWPISNPILSTRDQSNPLFSSLEF